MCGNVHAIRSQGTGGCRWEGSTELSAWEQSGLPGSLLRGWTWHPGPCKQPPCHGPLHHLEKPFLACTCSNCVWVHWLLDEFRGLDFLPCSPLETRGAPLGSPCEHTQLCTHLKSLVVASCKIHGDISRQSQHWCCANLLSLTESDTRSSLCEVDCSTQQEAKMFLVISRGRLLNSRKAVLSYFILQSHHVEKRSLYFKCFFLSSAPLWRCVSQKKWLSLGQEHSFSTYVPWPTLGIATKWGSRISGQCEQPKLWSRKAKSWLAQHTVRSS